MLYVSYIWCYLFYCKSNRQTNIDSYLNNCQKYLDYGFHKKRPQEEGKIPE